MAVFLEQLIKNPPVLRNLTADVTQIPVTHALLRGCFLRSLNNDIVSAAEYFHVYFRMRGVTCFKILPRLSPGESEETH
jgi:hypothetical protein